MKKTMMLLIIVIAVFGFCKIEVEAAVTKEEEKLMEQIHVPTIEEMKLMEKIDVFENLFNELDYLNSNFSIEPILYTEKDWDYIFWLVYNFDITIIEHDGFFYKVKNKEAVMKIRNNAQFTVVNCGKDELAYDGYETIATHVMDFYNIIVKYDKNRHMR